MLLPDSGDFGGHLRVLGLVAAFEGAADLRANHGGEFALALFHVVVACELAGNVTHVRALVDDLHLYDVGVLLARLLLRGRLLCDRLLRRWLTSGRRLLVCRLRRRGLFGAHGWFSLSFRDRVFCYFASPLHHAHGWCATGTRCFRSGVGRWRAMRSLSCYTVVGFSPAAVRMRRRAHMRIHSVTPACSGRSSTGNVAVRLMTVSATITCPSSPVVTV